MGGPVRKSDDDKPLKNEPFKNEAFKNETFKNEAVKAGPSASGPSTSGLAKNESFASEPSKSKPSTRAGAASSTKAIEAPQRLWMRRARRRVFEGDIAAMELRSRLTLLGADRIPDPVLRAPAGPKPGAALRPVGVVLAAAVAAGVGGYLWGFKLSTKAPEHPLAFDPAHVLPPSSTAADPGASKPNSEPAPSRTAAVGLAPADGRGTASGVTAVDVAPRPAPAAATPSPSSASPPAARADDPSEIAAVMKVGRDLMAQGDITAARMMFQRAAEAGEAAAAFALAETYDPAVLSTLHLRGAIAPDVALAQSWYEKARDLGSSAAPERIVRLTQIPR